MKPLPKQTRAKLKRQALVRAGMCEFSEHGYELTTTKSIAARAGVAAGTFYQYFDNKDEVLLEVSTARYGQLQDKISTVDITPDVQNPDQLDVRRLIREVLEIVHDFHAEAAGFHAVLEQRRQLDPALEKTLTEAEQALLNRVRKLASLYNEKEAETIAFCLFAMTEGLVHRHVFQKVSIDRDDVIEKGTDCITAYLKSMVEG